MIFLMANTKFMGEEGARGKKKRKIKDDQRQTITVTTISVVP
jgi:hypothetical protein